MKSQENNTLLEHLVELYKKGAHEELIQECSGIIADTSDAQEVYERKPSENTRSVLMDRCLCLRYLGQIQIEKGNITEATEYFTQAQSIAELLHDKESMLRLHLGLGDCNMQTGELESAIDSFKKALTLSKEIQNQKLEALTLNNLANVSGTMARYSEALSYYQSAMSIAENLGDTFIQAATLANIGNIYNDLGQHEYAIQYLEKSLQFREESQHIRGMAFTYSNLGETLGIIQEFSRAKEYTHKAIDLCKTLQINSLLSFNYKVAAGFHARLEEYEDATYYAKQSLAIADASDTVHVKAGAMEVLGNVYFAQNNPNRNPEEARRYFLEAIKIANDSSIGNVQLTVNESLIDVFTELEEYKKALHYARKVIELSKEQKGEDVTKAVQAEAIRFKEREVKILTTKNAEIAKAHEQLKSKNVEIVSAHEKSEELLLNILPQSISERLKLGEKQIADQHEDVSIFFSDIKGFTQLSNRISAEELVRGLNEIVTEMDRLTKLHGLEKIKTIGDAYMAVAGAPDSCSDHTMRATNFARDVVKFIETWNMKTTSSNGNLHKEKIEIRIGLHCGNVVAGIIGESKFSYDLWGDAVNTAARMESSGEAGRIHISEEFAQRLQAQEKEQLTTSLELTKRTPMEIKGKGVMQTYFLEL